jgi:hypothetical protein
MLNFILNPFRERDFHSVCFQDCGICGWSLTGSDPMHEKNAIHLCG